VTNVEEKLLYGIVVKKFSALPQEKTHGEKFRKLMAKQRGYAIPAVLKRKILLTGL